MSNNAQIEPQHLQKTAYRDLAVTESTPVIKASANYGLLNDVKITTGLSGVANAVETHFNCESGVSVGGFGAISTKDSLIFRPGQGEKDLFTARFSAGQVGGEQFAGLTSTNDALGFGYNGNSFGILLRYGGKTEIQELTITTPASGSENATITVDGVGYTVPLTSGTVQENAVEIEISLKAQVPLWEFQAVDNQVVTNGLASGPATGAFSFTSSTAIAVWVEVAVGVAVTSEWTPLVDWNGEEYTGLDVNNFNNYKIQVGPSTAAFSIFSDTKAEYINVHTINSNNTTTQVLISNPTFNHAWYAQNKGTSVSVQTEGSYCGLFREGPNTVLRPTASVQQFLSSVSTTPTPIISFRGRLNINNFINLAKVIITNAQITSDSAKTIVVTVITNGTLTDQIFQYVDKNTSVLEIDTSATAVTGGTSLSFSGLNNITLPDLEILLNRDSLVTLAVNVTANPASEFVATIAYTEDS